MSYIEKVIRRTGLPLTYSQGFNPHPKISFPTALSMGIESDDEVALIRLSKWTPPNDVLSKLNLQTSPFIKFKSITPIISNRNEMLTGFVYEVDLTDLEFDSSIITQILEKKEINIERIHPKKTKIVNIRPFINEIHYKHPILSISILSQNEGTAKPTEVLESLGLKSLPLLNQGRIRKILSIIKEVKKRKNKKWKK